MKSGVQYPGRPHSGINAADVYAIADGDPEATANCAEYGRRNIIERLNMFAPAITGGLVKTFQHAEAIGDSQREDITSRLIAKPKH